MLAVEVDDSVISFNAILHLHIMIEKQFRVIAFHTTLAAVVGINPCWVNSH
jgi:hypothetical protein